MYIKIDEKTKIKVGKYLSENTFDKHLLAPPTTSRRASVGLCGGIKFGIQNGCMGNVISYQQSSTVEDTSANEYYHSRWPCMNI